MGPPHSDPLKPYSRNALQLGFGVPYFGTFFGTCYLKGTSYEIEVHTFFSLVTSKPRYD